MFSSKLQFSMFIMFSWFIFASAGVKVCRSWISYLNPFSKNCFESPDGEPANVTQILKRWGCTIEEYQLLTKDDYYIFVIRAVMGEISNPTPIVMGHGIQMNSMGFVTMFNKTLAYHLLKKGYQIFFINFRGTRYTSGHRTLSQNDERFWKYSFHHMGQYDIPTAMDLVEEKTNGSKAIFIGFSMATTAVNIYCVLNPEDAENKFLGILEMAPIANLTGIRSVLGYIYPAWPFVKPLILHFWHGKLLPINERRNEFCSSSLFGIFFCYTINAMFYGIHYSMLDPLYLPVSQQQNLDVGSVMVLNHYYQILKSKNFQQYDYDQDRNMQEYGSHSPPIYNISKIPVPVALIVGRNDYLAEVKNARKLYISLTKKSRCGFHIIADPKWPHNGFIISKDIPFYLDEVVSKILASMESGRCSTAPSPEEL